MIAARSSGAGPANCSVRGAIGRNCWVEGLPDRFPYLPDELYLRSLEIGLTLAVWKPRRSVLPRQNPIKITGRTVVSSGATKQPHVAPVTSPRASSRLGCARSSRSPASRERNTGGGEGAHGRSA